MILSQIASQASPEVYLKPGLFRQNLPCKVSNMQREFSEFVSDETPVSLLPIITRNNPQRYCDSRQDSTGLAIDDAPRCSGSIASDDNDTEFAFGMFRPSRVRRQIHSPQAGD